MSWSNVDLTQHQIVLSHYISNQFRDKYQHPSVSMTNVSKMAIKYICWLLFLCNSQQPLLLTVSNFTCDVSTSLSRDINELLTNVLEKMFVALFF